VITPICGEVAAGAAGRRPEVKKAATWMLALFPSLQTLTTGKGLPLPL